MNAPEAPRTGLWRRPMIRILIFAPIGGVLGYAFGRFLKSSGAPLPDWSIGEIASVIIAVMLLLSGAYALLATTSPRRWNAMVEKQPADEPVDHATLRSGRWQASVAALAGVLMVIPPFAAHAALAQAQLVMIAAGLLVVLIVQSAINWKLWREGDELTRAVIAQTGAVCFWVLQLGLFAWAALTKLKLAAEIDSWSLMTVLMGAYMIVSVVISVRRGLVNV